MTGRWVRYYNAEIETERRYKYDDTKTTFESDTYGVQI